MSLPSPISLEQAQSRLLELTCPLGNERIAVEMALGRFLAKDVEAQRTQPHADLSAMDGYAVRPDELTGPWTLVGESAAGHPFDNPLKAGEAVRISTGATMPASAGAVLLQENAAKNGTALQTTCDDRATPDHIRRAGFDFNKGDILLSAGATLGPRQLALAIAGGHAVLDVGVRPRICVIDSGDELAPRPSQVEPHQIPASNGPMIAAMAKPYVESCVRIGPVADNIDSLIAAFEQAQAADVIVTSGGASVGDHDLLKPALSAWGAQIEFWRIAIKPGKPLLIAVKGNQIILGLPGNPASSYVTAFLFLLPLLRHLAGSSAPLPHSVTLALATELAPTGPRTEFVRAIAQAGQVEPLQQWDSSAIRTLATANALIVRPSNAPAASVGEPATTYLLENGGIA